ncbi:hypothetical protein NKI32_06170 [Mesorhizobium sp. M0761]|uniref:hypothetical protein n=1 Tax=unclassified Mesorhizobium TaxID=325217 RepID=UPI003334E486
MLAINPAQAPDIARKYGGLAQGMLDRRTREWRRRQELVDMFAQALGGADTLTPVTLSKVQTAAELSVAAELTRVRFIVIRRRARSTTSTLARHPTPTFGFSVRTCSARRASMQPASAW